MDCLRCRILFSLSFDREIMLKDQLGLSIFFPSSIQNNPERMPYLKRLINTFSGLKAFKETCFLELSEVSLFTKQQKKKRRKEKSRIFENRKKIAISRKKSKRKIKIHKIEKNKVSPLGIMKTLNFLYINRKIFLNIQNFKLIRKHRVQKV